ncbi:MAG: aminotransferase class I/II-fold pyridoxal phosphate-dependent enzyme [Oligoflexus sp.]
MRNGPAFTKPISQTSPAWQQLQAWVLQSLSKRREQQRFRQLKPLQNSPDWLDLTHNDYLGLGHSADFQSRVRRQCQSDPVGAGASRLLGGEHSIYQKLEAEFCRFKRVQQSLYVSSGYTANEMLSALLQFPQVKIFSDELNHASIIDGIRMSQLSKERRCVFPHNDMIALRQALQKSDAEINFIWTESVFSMDGDFAPLSELFQLAEDFRGILLVDEAHAIGCYGPQGEGLFAELGLDAKQCITINPCGKAVAAGGALLTGPEWFRDYLINFARPFIFSTAPSPWVAHAVHTAIQSFPDMKTERSHLKSISARLREALTDMGFDVGPSTSHIIPIIVGSEAQSMHLEEHLRQQQILAKAIRPPTVPPQSCRIRLSLNSHLTDDHINQLIEAFRGWLRR